ncbi:MAG TPA: MMPL family transporter [Candidatus Limnocylindrales bacterium]|nr:MMPL family transporter [Candidatus Limnocylindrales bacterium]
MNHDTGRLPGTDANPDTGRLQRAFDAILRSSRLILAIYAVLLVPSVYYAVRVGQDNSIDRLIVADDPDAIATREFEKVFGSGEYAILLAEADDPLAPGAIAKIDAVERALADIPAATSNSALSMYRRAKAGFEPTPEQCEAFRKFVSGTDLLRKQGLVGDHFLAIGVILNVKDTADRSATLDAIDRAVAPIIADPAPLTGFYRLGQPYVNRYLDETQRSAPMYFLLFTAFVIVLNLSLYRSVRTLFAFLITLAVNLAMAVGYIGWTGGNFTIVSPMVPMTILVTATASLVYLHSRFVDCPAGRDVHAHHLFALDNKFVACTASIFATAVGFAALLVSNIRPIREMGSWVAVGLMMTWVIVFTLFPALQKELATPTEQERHGVGDRVRRAAEWLPLFTYRWRWLLVSTALAMSAAGAVALFGLPGFVKPLPILTDPVEYMDPSNQLYKDTKRLGTMIPGLSVSQVWLKGELGSVSEPDVLAGLDHFQADLEKDPDIGAAVGPTTILRIMRYIGGEPEEWPKDADGLDALGVDLEGLVGKEPMLQRFVQPHELAQTHYTIVSHETEHEDFERLNASIRARWKAATERDPALAKFEMSIVGLSALNAKMAQSLVPTLIDSFRITVAIIFLAFLIVFRSGMARLLAMIPSLFAILVMFGVMRVFDVPLNVATILIASTILGTSENDQIHFFWHFQEADPKRSVELALRHTFVVAGRAIFFATLINAGGFLAFGLADLPSMRQFGVLAALAFVLSMIADFFALPAALWILLRAKPDPRPTS